MTPRVVKWISRHDDNWVFFVGYIVLSIVLSVFFNLGFFLILIVVHFLLDLVKHWHSNNKKTDDFWYAFQFALRDGFLLDFFLFVIAFAFGYVFHFTFAVAISNGARLFALVEIEDIVRILSRLVIADWVISHIAWLAKYVREIDTRKIYMPPDLLRHEVMMVLGSLVIIGALVLLPLVTGTGFETLTEYARKELIPNLSSL